ncbi:hypothetical protein Tco_1423267 [Tanacetum coccineum]
MNPKVSTLLVAVDGLDGTEREYQGLCLGEVAEPIDEAEEQMIALVVYMDEDIAMLFGDDDFEDDASEGFDEEELPSVYEVGIPSTAAAEGPSYPLLAPGLPIPPSVSDAKVAAGVTIGEIGPRVFAIEGQVQVMASQMVHAADSCAAERDTDSTAADYGLIDKQSWGHIDAVYYGDG